LPKRHAPRHGSLAYYPRKRAKTQKAVFRSYKIKAEKPIVAAFAGYKAGMTHVVMVDDKPGTLSYGQEVVKAVTIIETPPLKVVGLCPYVKTPYGLRSLTTLMRVEAESDLKRTFTIGSGIDNFEEKKELIDRKRDEIAEIRILVHTLPRYAGIHKKKPELMEIPIVGGNIEEQLDYAFSLIGKLIRVSDVFKEGQYVDVTAVTKGKGFQGVIKRFGVALLPHKAGKRRREVGSLGSRHPPWISWRVPRPGQMGYHKRTEYNKRILKIVQADLDEKGIPKSYPTEINLRGGFRNYGIIKSDAIVLQGSVPGPVKRLVMIRHAIRPPKLAELGEPKIISIARVGGDKR